RSCRRTLRTRFARVGAHRPRCLRHRAARIPCPTTERLNIKTSDSNESRPASERIDKIVADLGDWRGETLSRMRKLVKEADPDVGEGVEGVKANSPGTPTWSHDGIICTGEPYKSVVKLTFAKGATL